MTTLTRRDPRRELFEWLEAPWTVFRPAGAPAVRVEDYVEDGSYVVRAELPGLDPDEDLEVTVSHGTLTIRAERHERNHSRLHSEFRYGTFTRSLTLPAGVDETTIQAVYDNGILEVSAVISAATDDTASRTIPVRLHQHINPT